MTHNEIEEQETQKSIEHHVDAFTSFRFNAGAGAGKTHALIETLRYVAVNKVAIAKTPKKVACITYTNVAVNEIKTRLGNSETVYVSTIHERLWELIKSAQPQLLECHKEKVEKEIENNNLKLENTERVGFFHKLAENEKLNFIEFAKNTKKVFYEHRNASAKSFREAYLDNTDIDKPYALKDYLTPVEKFKYVVDLIYKNERLEKCLERIIAGQVKRVDYDSQVNTDRLHYMKFSHDTLLEYSLKLIENYPMLCRIVIDTYPYFFIDEYQDTHESVIKFFKKIQDYANVNNKKWMIGYFGDTAQNIYDDGVGSNIVNIHQGLVDVDKIFNRRSHQQIIDVANKIRADGIVQKPIVDDRNTGSVSFFYNSDSSRPKGTIVTSFLSNYSSDLKGDGPKNTKIHCLVLTNKLMASFNGFGDVYEAYANSSIYYENLNTQVLSQELEKLHPTVLSIYRLIKLCQDIQNKSVSYHAVFGKSSKDLPFSKATRVIRELGRRQASTLNEWIDLIVGLLEQADTKEALAGALINRLNYEATAVFSAVDFRSNLLDSIRSLLNKGEEDEETINGKVNSLLALPMTSLIKWADFIGAIETDEITYHTYHGTKGEEYENVAIILEHSFGRMNSDKFKNYFLNVKQILEGTGSPNNEHLNTKNLLYVACSRAIKNLRVLYLDDIAEIRVGIEAIFGEAKHWPVEM